MYCYTNYVILATTIARRLAKNLETGYKKLYKKHILSGITPVVQRMDN